MATEPVLGPNTIVYVLYPSGGTDTRKCSRYGAVSLPGSTPGTTGSSWAGTGCTERKVVHAVIKQRIHFLKTNSDYCMDTVLSHSFALHEVSHVIATVRYSHSVKVAINAPARWMLTARQTLLNIL